MRRRHAGMTAAALVAIGLIAAACSVTSGPGVASIGSTTTTPSAAGSLNENKAAGYEDDVKYAQCMQTHGVPDFPDPSSGVPFKRGLVAREAGIDTDSLQFGKANMACQRLLPIGSEPSAAQTQQSLDQWLKVAQCMRSNGVPNFPDPTESNGRISLQLSGGGLNPSSGLYQAANAVCKRYAPGGVGLPVPAVQAASG
jgi:hypothetical protein